LAARRNTRIEVSYDALLTTADGHKVRAVVRDLSATGFRVEVHDEVLRGELITLQVGKGAAVKARVMWSLGNEAGGVFLERPLQ
jgi:hypothetical protein